MISTESYYFKKYTNNPKWIFRYLCTKLGGKDKHQTNNDVYFWERGLL